VIVTASHHQQWSRKYRGFFETDR